MALSPYVIAGIVIGGIFLIVLGVLKWHHDRIRKATEAQLDFTHISELDETTFPDRSKGLILLMAGVASLCGFFIFFSTQQTKGVIK